MGASPRTHSGHPGLRVSSQAGLPHCPAALPVGGFLTPTAQLMAASCRKPSWTAWMDFSRSFPPRVTCQSSWVCLVPKSPTPGGQCQSHSFESLPAKACTVRRLPGGSLGPLGAPPDRWPLPTADIPWLLPICHHSVTGAVMHMHIIVGRRLGVSEKQWLKAHLSPLWGRLALHWLGMQQVQWQGKCRLRDSSVCWRVWHGLFQQREASSGPPVGGMTVTRPLVSNPVACCPPPPEPACCGQRPWGPPGGL